MLGYRAKIEKDLPHWIEQGWVSKTNGESILSDITAHSARFSFSNMLAILGAVLLCFGIMTFVAANWAEISKLGRLFILFSGLWIAYGAAIYCKVSERPSFADAALLVGVGIFGASIMLISQTYHFDGHAPDAVFMWGLGALATGVLGRSRPVLGAALILFTVWACWELAEQFGAIAKFSWLFLLYWLLCVSAFIRNKWRVGYHLAMLCFIAWLGFALLSFVAANEAALIYVTLFALETGLLIAGLGLVAGMQPARVDHFNQPFVAYGFAVLLFSAYMLQWEFGAGTWMTPLPLIALAAIGTALFAIAWKGGQIKLVNLVIAAITAFAPLVLLAINYLGHVRADPLWSVLFAVAAGVIALALWAIQFGWQRGNKLVTALGYITFGVELLYIYFRTFGTLLDTALFYLIAGVLLVAMGFAFARLERRSSGHQEVEQ
jgi:uncharacterized membrane protein